MGNEFQNILMHHGIQGQKWGVRRFQNEDGSLKPAGEKRYAKLEAKLQKKMDKAAKKGEKYAEKSRHHTLKGTERSFFSPLGDYNRQRADVNIRKYQRQAKKFNKASAKLALLRGDKIGPAMTRSTLEMLGRRKAMHHSGIDILTASDKRLLEELKDPSIEAYVKTLPEERQYKFYSMVDELLDDNGNLKSEYFSIDDEPDTEEESSSIETENSAESESSSN